MKERPKIKLQLSSTDKLLEVSGWLIDQLFSTSKVVLLFTVVGFISCDCKDDGGGSPLEGCCGKEAIDEDVGNGHIYVPNIFTPNGDGYNDGLFIATDSIQLIVEVKIRDKEGRVVYEVFDPQINGSADIWDGEVDDVIKEGLYSVSVTVLADDGTSGTFEGEVCNFPCNGNNVMERVPIELCQFPSQALHGYFGPTITPGEGTECFEYE